MIQLPDPSRLYDFFQMQLYGIPLLSILLLGVGGSLLGAWYWRANMKSETKMVQDNRSGLRSAGEFAKENEPAAPQPVSAPIAIAPTAPVKVLGYCVKCKEARELKDPKESKLPNGKPVMKGLCGVCGTKMNKFLPSAPKFDGHADTEALLLGVMIERLKTANISGGRVSMIIDPASEKTISLGKSQVDFDLGIPVSYEEHSSEVGELKQQVATLTAQLESVAAAQEAEEKEGA